MATVNLVSVCLGDSSTGSMRIGRDSETRGCDSTALGQGAYACGNSTALGQRAYAGCDSTALGQGASAGGKSTALGKLAYAGCGSTVLGWGASACGSSSTVLGVGAMAEENNSLVLQSGEPCFSIPAKSRIKIFGDNISFRINGVCKSMTGSAFFAALGLS